MNQGSGFRNHELSRRARALVGEAFGGLWGWWARRAVVVDLRERVAVVAGELVGDRFERPDRYVVAGEDSIGNNLTFGAAKEIGRQIADEGKPVLFGELLADGTLHVIQFFPEKDASMSDKPQGKHFPIHPNYDRSKPPIGYLVLDDEEAEKFDLGTMVVAPGGVADDDGHITEVVEFGVFPAERLRRREGQARLPLFGTNSDGGPVGYVELDEHLTESGIRNFVAVPAMESGDEGPTKAVSFKLEHREVVGSDESSKPISLTGEVPVNAPAVGMVRLSEAMVFQYGNISDLELVPIIRGRDEDAEVVGYQVVNKRQRQGTSLEHLAAGSYIFRVNEAGWLHALEQIPERHVVEFRDDGYSMQHPYECRQGGKSLHDCPMWDRVTAQKDEFEARGLHGRFYVDYDEKDDRLIFEEVPEGERLGANLASEEWGVRMNEGTSEPGAVRQAVSRAAAEAAAIGVGVVVHRSEDGEWVEPNGV